jgi:hypothetical protein
MAPRGPPTSLARVRVAVARSAIRKAESAWLGSDGSEAKGEHPLGALRSSLWALVFVTLLALLIAFINI